MIVEEIITDNENELLEVKFNGEVFWLYHSYKHTGTWRIITMTIPEFGIFSEWAKEQIKGEK